MIHNRLTHTLMLGAGLLLAHTNVQAEEIWSAKASCQSNFGLVNNCQTNTKSFPIKVDAEQSSYKLPRRVIAFFNASCARVAGKAPTAKVRFGDNESILGFTATPTLQTLETSAVSGTELSIKVEIDPKTSVTPDCNFNYFGSVALLDATLAESFANITSSKTEDVLSIRSSLLRFIEKPASLTTIKALPEELDAMIRRMNLNCTQSVLQANRRINLGQDRPAQDTSLIEFLLGNAFTTAVTPVDARAVCQKLETQVQGQNIGGLVLKYVNEIIAIKSLQERVTLALNELDQCQNNDPTLCTLDDPEPLQKVNSLLASLKADISNYSAFLKSELSRMAQEREIIRRNVSNDLSAQMASFENQQKSTTEVIGVLTSQLDKED